MGSWFDINWVFIEIIIILIIIGIQIHSFRETKGNIQNLKKILPPSGKYTLQEYFFHIKSLRRYDTPRVVTTPLEYHKIKYDQNMEYREYVERVDKREFVGINYIITKDNYGNIFNKIKNAINAYLLKNRGKSADYVLMQDIVQRNLDIEEQEVENAIQQPLYLGLIATMVGIIIGLIGLNNIDLGIYSLFFKVAIAMGASCLGLVSVVINNRSFKNAKKELEIHKNDFYTFLQIELMPIVNDNISKSVYTLQDVMANFTSESSQNLSTLDNLLSKNYKAIENQAIILDKLDNIDINKFVSANIKILNQLDGTIDKFESLQQYALSLDGMMNSTNQATRSINNLLSGVNNFSHLAQKLDSRIEDSEKLIKLATEHILFFTEGVDQVRLMRNDFSDYTESTLNTLKQVSEKLLTQAKNFGIEQREILESSLNNANVLHKLTYLDKLELIETSLEKEVQNSQQMIEILAMLEKAIKDKEVPETKLLEHNTNMPETIFTEKEREKILTLIDMQTAYLKGNVLSRMLPLNGQKNKNGKR